MSQYEEDLLLDALLDDGFTLDEAMKLIALQERAECVRRGETTAGADDLWGGEKSDRRWN